MTESSAATLLKQVSIFQGLNDREIAHLEGILRVKQAPKDTVIVNQEDVGTTLFIIEEGRVKVVLYGESGREITLSMFKPGDFFGEMSLLDGQPRSANVIAVEDTKLLALERPMFVKYVHEFPQAAINILAEMSARLRRADAIIGNLALLDVFGRVARFLREMAAKDGVETDEGIVVKDRPTQQDIASMVGTSRETVSRAINEFARRGYLVLEGRDILFRREFLTDVEVSR
jgi:CRP/FNR family transcriptional regulator, cyclic AMP receptor protein